MGKFIPRKTFYLGSTSKAIPQCKDLKRIGAGHDGYVYKDRDKVYKILKYDIDTRTERDLMTYNKLRSLETLDLKRFTKPIDFLVDSDGRYSGYVSLYCEDLSKEPYNKPIGSFTTRDLIDTIDDFEDDFETLTKNSIIPVDINRDSFLFPEDFLHICDMDKFQTGTSKKINQNWEKLNYIFARLAYIEKTERDPSLTKDELKAMNAWIKKSCNSKLYVEEIRHDLGYGDNAPIQEYNDFVFRKVLK